MPYLFALPALVLAFNKHTWFLRNSEFFIWLTLITLFLTSVILTICIHSKRYPLKKFLHVIFPFSSLTFIITILITLSITVPIGPFGETAIENTGREYRNGIFYTTYTYYNSKSYLAAHVLINKYNDYIYQKNGKTYLEIPNKHNNLYIYETEYYLGENIDIVIVPKKVKNITITMKDNKICNIKEIHYNGTAEIIFRNSLGEPITTTEITNYPLIVDIY